MVKTEAFPTIRMKIDRLLKITNEYQFNDLVKAVYCINLCINNRSVLESCLALNACLIEYEEKGSIYLIQMRKIMKVRLVLEVMLLYILHGKIKTGILQRAQLYLIWLM